MNFLLELLFLIFNKRLNKLFKFYKIPNRITSMSPVTYFKFTTLLFRLGFDYYFYSHTLTITKLPDSYQDVTVYRDFYAGLSKQSPLLGRRMELIFLAW